MKYVVCEEVCGLLNWTLGHQILSLCYKMMSNYDTVEFFYGESQINHCTILFVMDLRIYGYIALGLTPNFAWCDISGQWICKTTNNALRIYLYTLLEYI
jgi:hypothetical protein